MAALKGFIRKEEKGGAMTRFLCVVDFNEKE
jgi:hypothetical protein